jgi:molybdenum cofactor cytidylyltransferase
MRFFGIIPAAGLSVRMGCDKLLLPWGEATLIEATLAAWKKSRVDRMVVTVREEQTEVIAICEKTGAQVAIASSPPDMKASVLIGLDFIRERYAPTSDDAWLLAPADMPRLATLAIDALCESHLKKIDQRAAATILVPKANGRRGHPILFPWRLAELARNLGDDEGLNSLSERLGCEEIDLSPRLSEEGFDDIDTPNDFRRLSQTD